MYDDIIKRHRPRGWKVYHSKRRTDIALEAKRKDDLGQKREGLINCAVADFGNKTIRAPRVQCEYTLHILLHEYAHVHLGHGAFPDDSEKLPLHKQEYEADEWAMTIMKLEGVPVTKSIRVSSRRYVDHCITKDIKKGLPIHTHIARKAKVKLKEKEDE